MAKKDKNSIVSGAGLLAAFATDLFRELGRMRVSEDRAHTALSDPDVIRQFARMIADLGAYRIESGAVRGLPQLQLTLKKELQWGEYKYVDDGVHELLSESYMACLLPERFTIVQPGVMLTTEEAFQMLNERGYRSASFFELIFAASRDMQLGKDYAVLSLNPSTVLDVRVDQVLMVEPFLDNRQLVLRKSTGTTWANETGYLAVRN